jgi:hypothetical protein
LNERDKRDRPRDLSRLSRDTGGTDAGQMRDKRDTQLKVEPSHVALQSWGMTDASA